MDSFPLFGTSLLGSMSSSNCCFLTCRNTDSYRFLFFFFFFNSLTWVESERDREKTDGGTGGRTGTQAGKGKKENHERTYRPICCFPDTKRKQRTEKDTRFKMGIWKDGHPLGHFIQHPCQQKGIVSLFLSTRSFQTSETLRGGFLSPWREWLPHVP